MANVRVLTNIVPEELVEEAKVEYEKYKLNEKEGRDLTLEDYTSRYVNIFVLEEELAVKEKYLEILKKEIAKDKSSLNTSKWFIGMEETEEDRNIFSNIVFEDILGILFKEGVEFTSEEQLEYMLGFYFNNIRDIQKEYNFIIELKNLIKKEESSENGVPESLTKFYNVIEPFYYETQEELL